MTTFTETVEVKLTTRAMAEAFWNMNAQEQAEFFSELASLIKEDHKTNCLAYSLGELQWFHLGDQLKGDAREVLMSMASPLYLNVLRFSESLI